MEKARDPHRSSLDTPGLASRSGTSPSDAGLPVTPSGQTWPFAPGSQLAHQVAKPWVPKQPYRFNQP